MGLPNINDTPELQVLIVRIGKLLSDRPDVVE
jgi:hypothetical protein